MKLKLIAPMLLAACLAAAGLGAGTDNPLYLMVGADEKLLGNQDANDYFNLNGGQLGSVAILSGVIHAGLQVGRFASLEVSVNLGDARNNDVTYTNGVLGTTREVQTQWNMTTYSVTPALTFAWPGWVDSAGLRLGFAVLGGHVVDNAYGQDGSYDQSAMTPDIGLLFRTSTIFLRHFSVGLELGYDHTFFSSIQDANGTGTYSNVGNPEHNVSSVGHNGSQTSLDFSGPHMAVLVGLWGAPPASGDHGTDDQKDR